MIFVDSSVWIDYLRGTDTEQTIKLDSILGVESVVIGDLVLAEVLQGCNNEGEFRETERLLSHLEFVNVAGREIAIEAARNFRRLRERGVTIRKTIDTLIATRCIVSGYLLLHSDRDFEPFEKYLGLKCF